MKNRLFAILLALAAAFLLTATAFGASPGDIDAQNGVTLKDAVLSLQICAGLAASGDTTADVDGDGQIGLAEALFVLRAVASGSEPVNFSLGDSGVPDDYEQTIRDMSMFLDEYDTFIDQLPTMFDWRDQGVVTPAKHQGGCGSCWAFAAVGAMEAKIRIQGGDPGDLSEQQQVSCNSLMNGCSGGKADALKYWTETGPLAESCAGYAASETPCSDFNSCEILPYFTASYYTIDADNIKEVKSSLYKDGPAYFRFDVYRDFMNFWQTYSPDSVYVHAGGDKLGGHAVLIIGWDDYKKAWLCKNSWGATTGPNGDGAFWIAYAGQGHAKDLRFAMSNATLAADFKVTSPNGGEKWEAGKRYAVQWERGDSETVRIQLYNGQEPVLTIADATGNNGLYTWMVPESLPSVDTYRIRVTDTANSANDDYSDGTFSVISPLQVTSPNGGEQWYIGKSHVIEWRTGPDPGEVSVFLYRESDQGLNLLADQTPNAGEWSWTIPDTVNEGDDYKIIIKLFTNMSIFDESDQFFQISYPALPAPSNVVASDGDYPDKVQVAWDAVSDANYYQVYRNTEMDPAAAVALGDWQSGVSYPDADADPAQTYYYWVKAAKTVSGDGASDFSNADSGYAAACEYAVSPQSKSFPEAGGTGTIQMTASAACAWTAVSNNDWITIDSGGNGSGAGTIAYSVAQNTVAEARTGTLTVQDQTFTVTQDAMDCAYAISPQTNSFDASGGTGNVTVTANSGCQWTATSNVGWIDISSGASGTGGGTVGYSVLENTDAASRSGTLSIAGKTFAVEQSGRIELEEFTNSIGMTFKLIPAGTFVMGSPESEPARVNGETQHQVTLTREFYMQTTEATQAQWEAIMGSNPSRFSDCGGDCPVETVSWEDVQAFIAALNAVEERAYRLPTEAEWEYAARAGSETAFYNGGITSENCMDIDPNLDQIAWYCGNSDNKTHPAVQKQPNAWGFYDMSGNVYEWVLDWYGDYPANAVVDPIGPDAGDYRVFRGGSQGTLPQNTRTAWRNYSNPPYRSQSVGFRLVLASSQCNYAITPTTSYLPASGGTGNVTVTADSGCHWTAISGVDWISISSGASGTGGGTVNYSVSENTDASARTGTLSVAGKILTIEQDGQVMSEEFTNSIGMMFRRIPAGTFLMGSPESEPGRDSDETQHQVTLTQDYFIQTTEVTQAQWEEVMGSNPSYFSNCGRDCPVELVSWNNVQDFISALNTLDGRTYRLPTEAEWEYAARAGTTTAFYNGDITETGCGFDSNLDAIGWYCGNSAVTYSGCYDASDWGGPICAGPHPVAQKQPNAWGLYDMSGNVHEWVQDWYGAYPENASVDPGGPSNASKRVLRGGSWYYYARSCRSAYRHNYVGPSSGGHNYGFRLALSPSR